MKKNIKKYAKGNRYNSGSTMVEVLVAFMVVMLMIVLFTKILVISGNMLKRSHETIEKTETFNARYYQTEKQDERKKIDGLTFELQVDLRKGKTHQNNQASAARLLLESASLQLYLDSDGADPSASKDKGTGLKLYSFIAEEKQSAGEGS
ncbi:hypothetical protein MCG98_10830 [Ruminococcus sp. OA3]|uniref:hypothetical protein n=1 Tax=Ruminococcus sp. OA3 TaxID=2914164 RepID=UPI001F0605AC|nr:hypothetical protein [Ruminococcus sp. OA3]MCH1983059.1 hypothetical protein [Ruminococcus sp. OA3]